MIKNTLNRSVATIKNRGKVLVKEKEKSGIVDINKVSYRGDVSIEDRIFEVYDLQISVPINVVLKENVSKIDVSTLVDRQNMNNIMSVVSKKLSDFGGDVGKLVKYHNVLAKKSEHINNLIFKSKKSGKKLNAGSVASFSRISNSSINRFSKQNSLKLSQFGKDIFADGSVIKKTTFPFKISSKTKSFMENANSDHQNVVFKNSSNKNNKTNEQIKSVSYNSNFAMSDLYDRSTNSLSLNRSLFGTFRGKDLNRLSDDKKVQYVEEKKRRSFVGKEIESSKSKNLHVQTNNAEYDIKIFVEKDANSCPSIIDVNVNLHGKGKKIISSHRINRQEIKNVSKIEKPRILGIYSKSGQNIIDIAYKSKDVSRILIYKRSKKYVGLQRYESSYKKIDEIDVSAPSISKMKSLDDLKSFGKTCCNSVTMTYIDKYAVESKSQEYKVVSVDSNGRKSDEVVGKVSKPSGRESKVKVPNNADNDVVILISRKNKKNEIEVSGFESNIVTVNILKRNLTRKEKSFSIIGQPIHIKDKEEFVLSEDKDIEKFSDYEYAVDLFDKFGNKSFIRRSSTIYVGEFDKFSKVKSKIENIKILNEDGGIEFDIRSNLKDVSDKKIIDDFTRKNDVRDVFESTLQSGSFAEDIGDNVITHNIIRYDLDNNDKEVIGRIKGDKFSEKKMLDRSISKSAKDKNYLFSVETSVFNQNDAINRINIQNDIRKSQSLIKNVDDVDIVETNIYETKKIRYKPKENIVIRNLVASRTKSGNVLISWLCSEKEKIDFYRVERKIEDQPWENLGCVSSQKTIDDNFYKNDFSFFSSISYRVSIFDLDGKFISSETFVLGAKNSKGFSKVGNKIGKTIVKKSKKKKGINFAKSKFGD